MFLQMIGLSVKSVCPVSYGVGWNEKDETAGKTNISSHSISSDQEREGHQGRQGYVIWALTPTVWRQCGAERLKFNSTVVLPYRRALLLQACAT
jgi:hypothetical protein